MFVLVRCLAQLTRHGPGEHGAQGVVAHRNDLAAIVQMIQQHQPQGHGAHGSEAHQTDSARHRADRPAPGTGVVGAIDQAQQVACEGCVFEDFVGQVTQAVVFGIGHLLNAQHRIRQGLEVAALRHALQQRLQCSFLVAGHLQHALALPRLQGVAQCLGTGLGRTGSRLHLQQVQQLLQIRICVWQRLAAVRHLGRHDDVQHRLQQPRNSLHIARHTLRQRIGRLGRQRFFGPALQLQHLQRGRVHHHLLQAQGGVSTALGVSPMQQIEHISHHGHGFEHAAAPTRLQVSRQTLAWQRCGSGGINRHGKAPRYKKLGILPTPVGAPPQAVHNGLSIQ